MSESQIDILLVAGIALAGAYFLFRNKEPDNGIKKLGNTPEGKSASSEKNETQSQKENTAPQENTPAKAPEPATVNEKGSGEMKAEEPQTIGENTIAPSDIKKKYGAKFNDPSYRTGSHFLPDQRMAVAEGVLPIGRSKYMPDDVQN